MISRELSALTRPTRFILTILWFAMTASVVIYVGVCFAITQGQEPWPIEATVLYVMIAAACSTGAASWIVPGLMLSNERIRKHMRGDVDLEEMATNPQTRKLDEDRLARLRELSDLDKRLAGLPAMYFAPFIVGIALAESVAIFGLVLTFLSKDMTYIVPFAIAAIALMLLRYPRLEPLFDRASKLV